MVLKINFVENTRKMQQCFERSHGESITKIVFFFFFTIFAFKFFIQLIILCIWPIKTVDSSHSLIEMYADTMDFDVECLLLLFFNINHTTRHIFDFDFILFWILIFCLVLFLSKGYMAKSTKIQKSAAEVGMTWDFGEEMNQSWCDFRRIKSILTPSWIPK